LIFRMGFCSAAKWRRMGEKIMWRRSFSGKDRLHHEGTGKRLSHREERIDLKGGEEACRKRKKLPKRDETSG